MSDDYVCKCRGRASTAKVADYIGKTMQEASPWRQRLIDKQIIKTVGRGYVRFVVPYTGDYLIGWIGSDAEEDEFDPDEWDT